MCRLFNTLYEMGPRSCIRIPGQMKKDLAWLRRFLPTCSRVSTFWVEHFKIPDRVLATDASLSVMRAVHGKEYCRMEFPHKYRSDDFSYHSFGDVGFNGQPQKVGGSFMGKHIICRCDNKAVWCGTKAVQEMSGYRRV